MSPRTISRAGYAKVYAPGHPHAGNGSVTEHTLVAEKALGKFLPPGAHVHHVDGERAENRGGNLVVCQDCAYHRLLHVRQAALDACGNPNWRKCPFCGQYDDPEKMLIHARRQGKQTPTYCHRDCRRAYDSQRKRVA